MKIPTTLERKTWKKWQICHALAILLVLLSLPVYAGAQQTEQTQTPTLNIIKDGRMETITSHVYVKLPDGVCYLNSKSTGM